MWDFIGDRAALFWWLGVLSAGTFVVSLLAVPWIVARLPRDYFLREHPQANLFRKEHPVVRWTFLIGKNVLGLILVLGGIAMLVLPGQGILTILIGLMLLNFPGKREVELWVLKRSAVERIVNWIRRKRHRDPLLFPNETESESGTYGYSREQGS